MDSHSQPLLIYLHGFRSSPDSRKARITHQFAEARGLGENLLTPYLRNGPADTINELEQLLAEHANSLVGFIGSSLGGFYATVMAEYSQSPAVLINPAVRPKSYWHRYLGQYENFYSGDIHEVTLEHVQELEKIAPVSLRDKENYLVFLQRDDEVLDFRQAQDFYGADRCVVRNTGNHAYEEFLEELPAAFDFLLSRIDSKVR